MKPIGPSFASELRAAALDGLAFSWTDDGEFQFDATITTAQRTAIMTVYAAHDPAAPDTVKLVDEIVAAVQRHLDAKARSLGYDDIFTAVTYAEEPAVPKFQAEGQALRAWRSLAWEKCYAELARVQGGQRTIPTPDEAVAELPEFRPPGA